jgi:hypothetical protein
LAVSFPLTPPSSRRRGRPKNPSAAMALARRSFLPLLRGKGRGEGERGPLCQLGGIPGAGKLKDD